MTYSGDRILLSNQREGQASRFRAWIIVAVSLGAILFQVYVPRHVEFLRFLEMPLLITIYFALVRRNQISGLLVGAVPPLLRLAAERKRYFVALVVDDALRRPCHSTEAKDREFGRSIGRQGRDPPLIALP